jgi:hypothetical protein
MPARGTTARSCIIEVGLERRLLRRRVKGSHGSCSARLPPAAQQAGRRERSRFFDRRSRAGIDLAATLQLQLSYRAARASTDEQRTGYARGVAIVHPPRKMPRCALFTSGSGSGRRLRQAFVSVGKWSCPRTTSCWPQRKPACPPALQFPPVHFVRAHLGIRQVLKKSVPSVSTPCALCLLHRDGI